MSLLENLPIPQRRALDIIREVAADKGCRPYLVGGPVRDLLLGRQSIDIDLTLEDGSSTLARALARRIDGRVRSFPQFLTYKLTAEGFPPIDIATARKERYREPGALPAVSAGRLKDDLVRRDFSINAIALDLIDPALHDPCRGEADIAACAVRVLHDRSFVDDPTRVFRAMRLAVRLGFGLEPHTADLMAAAIESDALGTVSKERLWRELFLAMDEPSAPAILEELQRRGALDVLFGRRRDAGLAARLAAIGPHLEDDSELDRYVIGTGVLLRGDASPVDFEGSGFSQKRARAVVEIANELPRIEESLAAAPDDPERFRIYRGLSPEMRAVVAAEQPDQIPHLRRFREYEKFVLPLRGTDLEVPAGPHIALALEQTREALFDGRITPDEVRSYARETARRLLEEPQIMDQPPAR